MAYKIAVVGDKDSILPFKIMGFDVFFVHDEKEARQQIDTLATHDYGIIYVTEQIAQLIPETISRYDSQAIPALILIPNQQGSLKIGMDRIQKNVEKAVGQNIL